MRMKHIATIAFWLALTATVTAAFLLSSCGSLQRQIEQSYVSPDKRITIENLARRLDEEQKAQKDYYR